MEPSFCGTADRRILPVLIFWYCLHFCCCYGLNLRQCEQGWVQVPETSQSGADVLTCTGVPTSETVHWQFKSATGSRTVPFGTCPPLPGTCTSSLNTFTVSRPSTNVSHLTLSGSVSRSLAGATLYCYSGSTTANRVECQVDIVYPAEGVTCVVQLNFPTTFPWTASGHCDIAKIYSSQNNYNCSWLESNGTSAQAIASTYIEWSTSLLSTDTVVYSAFCTMEEKPIPARNANYTYSVTVSPGLGSVSATFNGSSIVRAPSPPRHDCATDYLPELSRLDCTCGTDDIGVPSASIQWMNSSTARLVVDRVTREQAGNYLCYLRWDTLILNATYNLKVAYGPDPHSASISAPDIFDTDGSRELTVNCTSGTVIPSPTFVWRGACVGQGHTCTFRPNPPDDVAVSCTVQNVQNNGTSDTTAKTIRFNYPPTTLPTITGYGGQPLFASQSFSLTCTVVGGVPPVTSVKLDCGGEEQNANGQNITLDFILGPQHHGQTCVCSAVWKQGELYTLTSEVAMTVYYAPIITAVTVNGAEGQVEVNESNTGHVSLSCSARARPTPDMQLLKDVRGELVQRKGGEVGDTDTAILTYRLPARCESSALYSCVAENSLGKSTLTNVTLVVLCSPRLNSENSAPDLPSVSFKGVPKNMTFDTWTSPVPVSFSFVFLGQDVKVIRSSQPARVNMFEIYCSKTGFSRATCVMTLTEATEEDEGYYAVIMRNTVGEGNFTFRVRVNDAELDYAEDEAEQYSNASPSSVLYLGVGVGVGVFVVVAAIVLTVFLWRRRQREHDGAQQLTESGPKRDSGYLTPVPPARHREDMTGRTGPLYEYGCGYLTPVRPPQHSAERTGPYATLDVNDINVASAYDALSHYEVISDNPADEDDEKGPNGQYETLQMTDVGLRSSYAKI